MASDEYHEALLQRIGDLQREIVGMTHREATALLATALPGWGGFASQVVVLAAGGSVAFGSLEFLEGHAPLSSASKIAATARS